MPGADNKAKQNGHNNNNNNNNNNSNYSLRRENASINHSNHASITRTDETEIHRNKNASNQKRIRENDQPPHLHKRQSFISSRISPEKGLICI